MTKKTDDETLLRPLEQRAAKPATTSTGRANQQRSTTMSVQEAFEVPQYRRHLSAKPAFKRPAKGVKLSGRNKAAPKPPANATSDEQPVTWTTVRTEFEAALAAERATWQRDENKIGAPPSPEALRYRAAYKALMAFPSPDAAGLALKIASHHGSPDFSDFDEALPHAGEWLSIYNDALALAPPASWLGVAVRLGKVLGWVFGVDPDKDSEFRQAAASTDKAERLLASAYRAASVAATDQPAAVIATSLLEELGRVFAADIFPQYVVNPGALANIADTLCSAQADARDLLRELDPMSLGVIYRDVTFAGSQQNQIRREIRQEMREVRAMVPAVNAPDATDDVREQWLERQHGVLAQIEALPCTPENAKIKAEGVAHIYCQDDDDVLNSDGTETTDVRLAIHAVRCLIGGDA